MRSITPILAEDLNAPSPDKPKSKSNMWKHDVNRNTLVILWEAGFGALGLVLMLLALEWWLRRKYGYL